MSDVQVDAVGQVRLFAELEPAEIELLASSMNRQTFPPGSVVTEEGSAADAFFVIERGEADVVVHGRPMARLGPGDFFGEVALLMGSERTATVTAATELACLVLSSSNFAAVVETSPSIALRLLEAFSDREL